MVRRPTNPREFAKRLIRDRPKSRHFISTRTGDTFFRKPLESAKDSDVMVADEPEDDDDGGERNFADLGNILIVNGDDSFKIGNHA